jgi:hypothetical protein
MVDGKADCDGFSVLAATILKASEYQVVLFIYRHANHVNIGVHLETKPYCWDPNCYPTMSLDYKEVRYYPLECAGQNPTWGYLYWRVRELPSDLADEFKTAVCCENLTSTY